MDGAWFSVYLLRTLLTLLPLVREAILLDGLCLLLPGLLAALWVSVGRGWGHCLRSATPAYRRRLQDSESRSMLRAQPLWYGVGDAAPATTASAFSWGARMLWRFGRGLLVAAYTFLVVPLLLFSLFEYFPRLLDVVNLQPIAY